MYHYIHMIINLSMFNIIWYDHIWSMLIAFWVWIQSWDVHRFDKVLTKCQTLRISTSQTLSPHWAWFQRPSEGMAVVGWWHRMAEDGTAVGSQVERWRITALKQPPTSCGTSRKIRRELWERRDDFRDGTHGRHMEDTPGWDTWLLYVASMLSLCVQIIPNHSLVYYNNP